MKVDNHLLRRMLETIEAAPAAELAQMPELADDPDVQRHHLQLLIDGNCVTPQQLRRFGRPCALGLTLADYELLNQLRGKNIRRAQVWLERLLAVSVVRLVFGAG